MKSKSKCYPSYRVWPGAFRPSRRSVVAGQQPASFDWSWDSHLLWSVDTSVTDIRVLDNSEQLLLTLTLIQGGATPDGVPPSLSRQLHEPSATTLRQTS